MNAKFETNGFGVAVHADIPLNANDNQYRLFLDELQELEGVEDIQGGRYFVQAVFGFMFDPAEMVKNVLALFAKYYKTEVIEEIPQQDKFDRAFFQMEPPQQLDMESIN